MRKASGKTSARKKQQAPAPVEEDSDILGTPENVVDRMLERDPNATKIALPFSDTPINNRNKEFRKKGGAGAGGGRRSSMSMRGRRASSLIENGHSAIPHREVGADQFFKHIEAEGLSEPRRMKQLLTWCGERALSEKPAHGTSGAGAVLGGKYSGVAQGLAGTFADDEDYSSCDTGPAAQGLWVKIRVLRLVQQGRRAIVYGSTQEAGSDRAEPDQC